MNCGAGVANSDVIVAATHPDCTAPNAPQQLSSGSDLAQSMIEEAHSFEATCGGRFDLLNSCCFARSGRSYVEGRRRAMAPEQLTPPATAGSGDWAPPNRGRANSPPGPAAVPPARATAGPWGRCRTEFLR